MSLKKSAFQKNKYSILKSAISREMADFCFAYFLNKRKVARFLFDKNNKGYTSLIKVKK